MCSPPSVLGESGSGDGHVNGGIACGNNIIICFALVCYTLWICNNIHTNTNTCVRSVLGESLGSGTVMGGSNSSASQYVVGLLCSMVWCKYNNMVWYVIVVFLVRFVSAVVRMINTCYFMYLSSLDASRDGTTAAQPARTKVTQLMMSRTMKTTVVKESRSNHCLVHRHLPPIRSFMIVLVFIAMGVGSGNGGERRVGRPLVPVETSNKLPSLPPPNTKTKLKENENENEK